MRFENLNITGIDGCSSPQIDNFNRPGNIVGDGWGIATPSGYAWSTTGQAYMDPGIGWLYPANSASTPAHSVASIVEPGPWDGEATFLIPIVFPEVGSGSSPESGYIASIADSAGLYSAAVAFSPSVTDGEVTLWSGTGSVVVGTTAVQVALPWIAGDTYMMRWEHGRPTTGTDRVRIWLWSEPEPSTWDLELGSTGFPKFTGSASGPHLSFDDFTLAAHRPQAWGIGPIDADYAGRPCSSCSPVFDTFASSPNVPFDCVTQDVEWASTGGSTLEAEVSQGAQIVGGDPLVVEFRANSSDGDYPSLLYAHEYSDDNRCDFNITAAVGGSLTPFVVLPTVAHVVGGTSVTTAGIEISTSGGSGADCSTSSFGISVSFSQLLSSYDALIPEPGHPDASYGAFGGNTTQTFFPSAFVDFMGVCGIALDADGPSQVYLGDSSVDFTISPSTTYNLSLEVEAGTGSLWVWDDSDPQPTEPTIQAAVSSSTFGVFVQQSLFSDDGFSVTLSNLSSQGSEPSTSDQAENGPALCQPFVGGVHGYTVSQPYVFASTRVYVDGTFQRRDIDYAEVDPAAGTIYFGVAPAPPATVTICFTPAVG